MTRSGRIEFLVQNRSVSRGLRTWGRIHFELLLFLPCLIFVVTVSFVPLVYAIVQSLHESRFLDFGAFVGIENYIDFLSERSGIGNSLIFVAGCIGLTIPWGVGLALALHAATRFRQTLRTILILPWLLSSVVIGKLWMWLLSGQFGPVAYLLQQFEISMPNAVTSPELAMPAVILAQSWSSYPFVMVLTLAALQTLPKEVLEAAALDGAVGFRRTIEIVLPLIRNTILVAVVLTSVNAFNHVTLLFVMTGGGPVGATETLALRIFDEGFRFYNTGLAAAGAVVMFVLNILFTIAYIRVLKTDVGA
jgi:multiple sugar transport system permease protein